MTTDPPPRAPELDTPWGADDDEADLPPALSFGLRGKRSSPEGRATPPPPSGHAAQPVVELGELDDPSLALPPRGTMAASPPTPRARGPATYTPTPARGIGAVRASEQELFLDHEAVARRQNAATMPVRRRSAPAFAAAQPRTAAARLPVPRAPSIPPSLDAASARDRAPGPDPLDALDAFAMGERLTPPPPALRAFGRAELETLPPLTPVPEPPSSRHPKVPDSATAVRSAPGSGAKPSAGRRTQPPVGLRLGQPVRRATPAGQPEGGDAPRPPESSAAESGPTEIEPPPSSVVDRALEMQAIFDAHNYTRALVLAESVLGSDPDHAAARRCAERCREALAQKYLDHLGSRADIPRVVMSPEEIRWLALDHRAGFLLSFIDGSMSIEEVLDVSSMPALDALRLMYELREQGAIAIVEASRPQRRR